MFADLKAGWEFLPADSTGAGDDRETVDRYLHRNNGCSFAAFDDGKMVGALLAGHDGRRALLNHLFVRPEYRRRGIARQLAALSFGELRNQGVHRAAVFIHKTNDIARRFWETVGGKKVDFIETYGIDF